MSSFWDQSWQVVLAVVTWLTGEVGRVALAGAMGGLLRWLHQEKRRLIDGVIAVVGGFIAAIYLPPVIVAFMSAWGVSVTLNEGSASSVGFVAGLVGMSFIKFFLAFFEVRMAAMLRRTTGANENDQ